MKKNIAALFTLICLCFNVTPAMAGLDSIVQDRKKPTTLTEEQRLAFEDAVLYLDFAREKQFEAPVDLEVILIKECAKKAGVSLKKIGTNKKELKTMLANGRKTRASHCKKPELSHLEVTSQEITLLALEFFRTIK